MGCLLSLKFAYSAEINLRIGDNIIRATVSDTSFSREMGLMKTSAICGNCGMLFVFPLPGRYRFWMRDTPLPLSIAFITAAGSILSIEEMQAGSTAIHQAPTDIIYALEMNKGWFAEHAIKPFETLQGLSSAPKGQ